MTRVLLAALALAGLSGCVGAFAAMVDHGASLPALQPEAPVVIASGTLLQGAEELCGAARLSEKTRAALQVLAEVKPITVEEALKAGIPMEKYDPVPCGKGTEAPVQYVGEVNVRRPHNQRAALDVKAAESAAAQEARRWGANLLTRHVTVERGESRVLESIGYCAFHIECASN